MPDNILCNQPDAFFFLSGMSCDGVEYFKSFRVAFIRCFD